MNIPQARTKALELKNTKPHIRRAQFSDNWFIYQPCGTNRFAKSCAEVNAIIARHGAEQK